MTRERYEAQQAGAKARCPCFSSYVFYMFVLFCFLFRCSVFSFIYFVQRSGHLPASAKIKAHVYEIEMYV